MGIPRFALKLALNPSRFRASGEFLKIAHWAIFFTEFHPNGFDPHTSYQSNKKAGLNPDLRYFHGGDDGDRTHGLSIANAALSQLSYIPKGVF